MSASHAAGPGPSTVLVVDDDPLTRLLARESLEQSGFVVDEAADGGQALEWFTGAPPDLVLLDVNMPVKDGFTVCAELRAGSGRHTPILMMTGLDDLDSIRRAYDVGATDFINKPINWVILAHRVEYMLRASRDAARLRDSQAQLANAQRIARLGYWEWQTASDELVCSEQVCRILGRPAGEPLLPRSAYLELVHPADRAAVRAQFRRLLEGSGAPELEYRIVRPDGSERHVRQQAEAAAEERGAAHRVAATIQDVTEHKRAEDKIRFLSYFDGLTGLPNRRAVDERLRLAIDAAARHRRLVAVLFLDLDRFQRINDTFGHPAGDELLREVAERLLASVRSSDCVGRPVGEAGHLVARFGGDEFVVLLGEVASAESAGMVAGRLSQILAAPFHIEGREVFVTSSIGITVFPQDGRDPETLFKNSDAAMSYAKQRGRNNFQFYNAAMTSLSMERLVLEGELRRGLEREEFELHYEPLIGAADGGLAGAEALLRWRHPERGQVLPGRFIGAAEECGLIVELGAWVLDAACRQMKSWRQAGAGLKRMSVNLSSRQFGDDGFLAAVAGAVEGYGLEPGALDLELTESMIVHGRGDAVATLKVLKSLGVRLTLDDFGTGYSSLSYLQRFPLDALKIDRTFIAGIPDDPDHVALTRAILAMARSLGLAVVAEGVETEVQRRFLIAEGCDELQGYLFGRAADGEEFARRHLLAPASV